MNQGLTLQGVGISDRQQQSIEEYWDIYDETYQMLSMMGFDELQKPPGDFPHVEVKDYENIEGENYTRTMAWIDIWFVYASDRLAWFRGQRIGLTEELKDIERELKK